MKIGDSLVLEEKLTNQSEKFKTKILDINSHSVFIDFPINLSTNKTVYVADGKHFKVTYVSPDGTAYVFFTEVLGKVKGTIPMVRLKKPDEDDFIKIQRREFVRIETTIDAAIHSSNMEFTPFTTVTEDISAGGTAILIPKDITLSPDSSINTWLALPLKSGIIQYLNIKSRFVRLIEREGSTKNIASIKFTDISDSDRQIIIRFCFEKQLENRNNV